ncbi:MAG: hypothetical protein Alpg2KO_24090 [Alphaproteobacteria bacterium]
MEGSIVGILTVIGMFIAALTIAGLFLMRRLRDEVALSRRMDRVTSRKTQSNIVTEAPVKQIIEGQKRQSVDGTIAKLVPTLDGMRRKFRQAGLPINLTIYVGALLVLTAGAFFWLNPKLFVPGKLLGFLPPAIVPIILMIVIHLIISNGVLNFLIQKRKDKIVSQMPLMLDFLVRSVTVGQPIDTALRESVHEIEDPIQEEVETIVQLVQIGTPLDRALRSIAREIEIREFDFFCVATIVQIEAGGNLGVALRNLSDMIRQRHQMRLKVQALAAEGKASAYVLALLPLALLGYFQLANPEYSGILFDTPQGNTALGIMAVLVFIGGMIMRKMVHIKI